MDNQLDDVVILVGWYARYGRTADLRLRAAQVELAIRIMDAAEPGWRDSVALPVRLDAHHLPQPDVQCARHIVTHLFPGLTQ